MSPNSYRAEALRFTLTTLLSGPQVQDNVLSELESTVNRILREDDALLALVLETFAKREKGLASYAEFKAAMLERILA